MSFVITLHVREGIVLASDSRLTLNTTNKQDENTTVNVAVASTDSNYKTFLAYDKIGISTFGNADINGTPLAGYIETFIKESENEDNNDIEGFCTRLLNYFREIDDKINTGFHVAGYQSVEGEVKQKVFRVFINQNRVQEINTQSNEGKPVQGATWDGESDILTRLIQPVFIKVNNNNYQALPHFSIPWQFFTLQDAVDFSVFAVRSTIEAIKFFPRAKTIGGPIDVLVIKPNEAKWISRKELKIN